MEGLEKHLTERTMKDEKVNEMTYWGGRYTKEGKKVAEEMTAEEYLKGKVQTFANAETDKVLFVHYWDTLEACRLSKIEGKEEASKEIETLKATVEAYKLVNSVSQDKLKRLLGIILESPPTIEDAENILTNQINDLKNGK